MARVLDMQDEFIRRANRPDGKENKKRVKEYYCKIAGGPANGNKRNSN